MGLATEFVVAFVRVAQVIEANCKLCTDCLFLNVYFVAIWNPAETE